MGLTAKQKSTYINSKVPNQPNPFPPTATEIAQPEGWVSSVACKENRKISHCTIKCTMCVLSVSGSLCANCVLPISYPINDNNTHIVTISWEVKWSGNLEIQHQSEM